MSKNEPGARSEIKKDKKVFYVPVRMYLCGTIQENVFKNM